MHGLWTIWYENGQKKWEGTYKDGKAHGLQTWWYDNGQKRFGAAWKDGKQISRKNWDEDGKLTHEYP